MKIAFFLAVKTHMFHEGSLRECDGVVKVSHDWKVMDSILGGVAPWFLQKIGQGRFTILWKGFSMVASESQDKLLHVEPVLEIDLLAVYLFYPL